MFPLDLDRAAAFGFAFGQAGGGQARERKLARVAAIEKHPADLVAEGMLARLDPAMVAIDRLTRSIGGLDRGSAKTRSTSAGVAGQFSFQNRIWSPPSSSRIA